MFWSIWYLLVAPTRAAVINGLWERETGGCDERERLGDGAQREDYECRGKTISPDTTSKAILGGAFRCRSAAGNKSGEVGGNAADRGNNPRQQNNNTTALVTLGMLLL